MGVRVVNKRRYKGDGYYIGRPSVLGNPYKMPQYSREECVSKYREYLQIKMQSDNAISREIRKLAEYHKREGDLTLICWCAPKSCHGDIIAEIIVEHANKDT